MYIYSVVLRCVFHLAVAVVPFPFVCTHYITLQAHFKNQIALHLKTLICAKSVFSVKNNNLCYELKVFWKFF